MAVQDTQIHRKNPILNKLDSINLPDIDITARPPTFTIEVKISPSGKHETLGLITETTDKGVKIISCQKSTPSAKILKWR